jgi:hypothetical protein
MFLFYAAKEHFPHILELWLLVVDLCFRKLSEFVVFKAIIASSNRKPFETIIYKFNRSEGTNSKHIKLCRFAMLEVVIIITQIPIQGFCKMKSNGCYRRLLWFNFLLHKPSASHQTKCKILYFYALLAPVSY